MGMLNEAAFEPAFDEFAGLDLPQYFFTGMPRVTLVGPCVKMLFTLDEMDRGRLIRTPMFRAICPLENALENRAQWDAFISEQRSKNRLLLT